LKLVGNGVEGLSDPGGGGTGEFRTGLATIKIGEIS
jgi:hypothetical protein